MRILFITPYVPSLIRVRPFNFIKQLSRRHEIMLVSIVQGEKDAAAVDQVREYCEKVYAFRLSKARSLASCCRRLLSRTPLQAAYTDLPSARTFVSRMAERGIFDLLHVEHIRGAHLVGGVKCIPRIFDSVDCITRLLKLRLAQQRGTFQRALGYEELLKMRSYEPTVAAAFDSVVITSRHEKRALEWLMQRSQNAESSRVAVVGNGVDSDYFRPMENETPSGTIVFSGKMSYFPNVTGVLHFYSEVFPRIRRRRPDARLKIVGSDPPDAIRRLARDPAVEVTGYSPDIRPHIASAEVVVCPLTIGVGIQNKVLEAMAMGKPVVATSVACKGIPDAFDGRDLIYADEPSEMAESVLRIMDNPQLGQRLGENARRLVGERYSWDAVARELEAVHAYTVDAYRGQILTAA